MNESRAAYLYSYSNFAYETTIESIKETRNLFLFTEMVIKKRFLLYLLNFKF